MRLARAKLTESLPFKTEQTQRLSPKLDEGCCDANQFDEVTGEGSRVAINLGEAKVECRNLSSSMLMFTVITDPPYRILT